MAYPEHPDQLYLDADTIHLVTIAQYPSVDIPYLDIDLADDNEFAQASVSYDFDKKAWNHFIYLSEEPDTEFSRQVEATYKQVEMLQAAIPVELHDYVEAAQAQFDAHRSFDGVNRPDETVLEAAKQPAVRKWHGITV